VGQAAKERLITHPGMTAASFKRLMGSKEATFLNAKGYMTARSRITTRPFA
jgi:molecular chaperone DnaK (HSP70)